MEKEFIPYEQALALKELGFDEPCLAFWTNSPKYKGDNIQLCVTDGRHGYSPNSISFKQDFLREGEILAPTFSQAFRWFREKYNIQGYIYSSTVRGNSEKTKQFTGYIWNINGIDMPFLSTDARDELHDTYEEAELECLKKLIEIVKTK